MGQETLVQRIARIETELADLRDAKKRILQAGQGMSQTGASVNLAALNDVTAEIAKKERELDRLYDMQNGLGKGSVNVGKYLND